MTAPWSRYHTSPGSCYHMSPGSRYLTTAHVPGSRPHSPLHVPGHVPTPTANPLLYTRCTVLTEKRGSWEPSRRSARSPELVWRCLSARSGTLLQASLWLDLSGRRLHRQLELQLENESVLCSSSLFVVPSMQKRTWLWSGQSDTLRRGSPSSTKEPIINCFNFSCCRACCEKRVIVSPQGRH